jgi:type VI secretion system protein ImpH
MAPESRSSNLAVVPDPVWAHLRHEPFCFEFFQAVQLLERLAPRSSPVGRFVPPHTEAARFGAHLTMAFPASEIQELTFPEDGPPMMRVNFMGVVGPLGVMPLYYTDFAERREAVGDTALRDFLDLFHHRIISLFYRAWQKYRFRTLYGRGDIDRFRFYLLNLVGLGHPELCDRQKVADDSILFYTGLIAQQPRSVVACENILADYFGVPVRIEQFSGAWYRLDTKAQTQFRDSEDISGVLGGGAVIGDEVWEPQARVRVVLGPLTLKQYREFLPVGSAYQPLKTLVRFLAGEEFDFDLQLILVRDQVPEGELGVVEEQAPLLGWLSWARNNPMGRDPSETILPL